MLRHYPVAVITHAAFMTADDDVDEMARCWVPAGTHHRVPRTLTVVDERLKAAKTFCVSMRELGWALDTALKTDPRRIRGDETTRLADQAAHRRA